MTRPSTSTILTAGGMAVDGSCEDAPSATGTGFAFGSVTAFGGGFGLESRGSLEGGSDSATSTASSPTSTNSSGGAGGIVRGAEGGGMEGGIDGGEETRFSGSVCDDGGSAGGTAGDREVTGAGDSVEMRAPSSVERTRSSKSIASASDGREISLSRSSDTARARFSSHHVRQATGRALFVAACVAGCASRAVETPAPAPAPTAKDAAPPVEDAAGVEAGAADAAHAEKDAGPSVFEVHPLEKDAIDGPHEELSVDAGRPVWYALPKRSAPDAGAKPLRLVAHLHGVCGGPPYACGKWIGAGTATGVMVCPTGNAHCGESPYSPPSWEAPTWMDLVGIMDQDLETSINKVAAKKKGAFTREGAILTGYSRGAFAAPQIARSHPNRWRHLVLIEANAPLSVAGLKAAGVRSVALVAGEQGDQIQGMTKTAATLTADGFPAKLFVMKKTSHPYSADMEDVMAEALAFVLQHDAD